MVAAVYCRKSTDQSGVSDDQKSVTRQLDHARQYAERKGWAVDDRFIYVDDGVSGAEFANRPGYVRLMNALTPSAPFQVLVVSELSRMGRENLEIGMAVKNLAQAGVRIFSYLDDRELVLDTAIDRFLMTALNFGAELEREKATLRSHDKARQQIARGHVAGGACFGFDNVRVDGHVERQINKAEADVVRRIFDLSANGSGFTRIAKLLNAEGAPSPRAQQGRPTGWAPTSVREILGRRLYIGDVEWNKTRKRNCWGKKARANRPEADWLRQSVPALRIVSDDVWTAAHGRLAGIRAQLGTTGRRRKDVDSRHLLAGFARCARGPLFSGEWTLGNQHALNRDLEICRARLAAVMARSNKHHRRDVK